MTNVELAKLTHDTATRVRMIIEEWRTRVRVSENLSGWSPVPINARAQGEARKNVTLILDGLEHFAKVLEQMADGDMARVARAETSNG